MPKPKDLWDVEVEQKLLGSILIDPARLTDCIQLDPSAFHDFRHQAIWRAFLDLDAAGEVICEPVLLKTLEHTDKLEAAGGENYLFTINGATDTGLNAKSYFRIVADYQVRRRMLAEAQALTIKAYDLKIPLPEPSAEATRKISYTASEILSLHFAEDAGPIPGIIPIGLTVLGSRPKAGKSRLMLQASCSWGVGGKFLDFTMPHLKVLYYSLDDPERRLQDRLKKMGLDPAATVTFKREIEYLDVGGGVAKIEQEANDFDVIIIDTIRRAMPGRDFNKDGAVFDEILGQLQSIGQNKHMSIITSLHTRKSFGQDFDPVDDVLGSTGLTASADCVLAIYRQPDKTKTLFKGRHKDFGDIDLTIEFDPITNAWQLVGITGEVLEGENENEIIDVLSDLGKAKASQIAKAINKDRGNTSRRCSKLWVKGLINKEVVEDITYFYLPTQVPTHTTQDTHTTQGTQGTQGTQAV